MGLAIVEFVMTIEEEFQIAISDADANQCDTVGKFVDLAYSRLRKDAEETCPSQHGFYVVRKKLMDILGAPRSEIRPDTRLDELIPKRKRRAYWKRILQELTEDKNTWPHLGRPRSLNMFVLVTPFMVLLLCLLFCRSWVTVPCAFVLAIFALFIVNLITVPLGAEFPEGFRFVKDLVKFVRTLDTRTWSRDEVFQKVKEITVQQLCVDESRVTEDARFVNDLGL